jgi:hypothetical protein
MLELINSLTESLPWFLRLDGAPHLHQMIGDRAAAHGLIRGDDWTRVFLVLYQWLALLGVVWGVGVALLVIKRPARGRFRGDPDRYRDAIVKGLLHAASVAAGGALLVLVLFLTAAAGPAPVIWLGGAILGVRIARLTARRWKSSTAPAKPAAANRKAPVL